MPNDLLKNVIFIVSCPIDLRVLITGASGFIGGYLSDFLQAKGFEVYGTFYSSKEQRKSSLVHCDTRNFSNVCQVIKTVRPEVIYHLAAQSRPTISWEDPWVTMEVNVLGTVNLFESVRRSKINCRIVVACSSAEYGRVSESEIPIKEDCPLRPLSPYAVSKVAQDLLAYQYFENYGLDTVRARIFGTTGPGKRGDVCSDFARRIAAIERGDMKQPMRVGNLNVRRDLTDVRDMVGALYLLAEKGVPGEVYNVCSGSAFKISELLNMLLGLSRVSIDVKVDESLLRASDEPVILGDNSKIRSLTGWVPEVPIEKTSSDTYTYYFWRDRVLEVLV